MLVLLIILILIVIIVFGFLRQKKFGKLPNGNRLFKNLKSPHYKKNAFENLSYTPSLTEGVSFFTILNEFIFYRNKNIKPKAKIPSTKTNLFNLNIDQNVLVWFGHSSYFMQIDGKRILVDPVLSGSASPIPNGTKAFEGSNIYSPNDIPEIDFLFITHDHWDHLDYDTIVKLKPKIKKIITGLGTGEHLEYWGYDKNIILEHDWNETISFENNVVVHVTTARHFSGRGLKRNKALWVSLVLQTNNFKIFIGGDSGYDKHFLEIGEKFGPFDLVILENGQYDKKWRYIHMLPNEFMLAAKELNAKRILPVHSAKFALSNHDWNEPLDLITKYNEIEKLNIITPMIGELVELDDTKQTFKHWWKEVVI